MKLDSTDSIQANWTANGNPAGTEYYCENITTADNSGWIMDTNWISTGLSSATTYAFQVKARNEDGIETLPATNLGSKMTQYDPIINSMTPNSGPAWSFIKVGGQYFYDYVCCIQFTGGTTGIISEWADSTIYCRVPSGTISGDVTVYTSSQSNSQSFTITDPNVIYVNPSNISRMESGTLQYPFSTIQRGLDAATSGDEIIIAADTYLEDIYAGPNIELHFTGDSTVDGQVTTELGSNIISDGSLTITGTAELGGDINVSANLTFQAPVTAVGSDQQFDAGTGTLLAMDTITKTTAGNLTLASDTLIDLDTVDVQNGDLDIGIWDIPAICQVAGNLQASSGVRLYNGATLDDPGDQSISGSFITTKTVSKINSGNLVLVGSPIDLVNNLDAVQNVSLSGYVLTEDGATLIAGGDFTAADGTSISSEGTLTIEADDNITLGGNVQTDGKLILTPDMDTDAIGDVWAKGTLTTTLDDIAISASGNEILLDDDVIADANLVLADYITVAADTALRAGFNFVLADANSLTGQGALTIEAGNNIILSCPSEVAGDFALTANSDANGLGDVLIEAPVTLTAGSFTSSGVDFYDPNSIIATNGGNITINHTGTVTLCADLNPNGGSVNGSSTKVIITPTGKIQDGLDVCAFDDGADVMVQDGTYTGVDNRDIDFRGKSLTLHSENGPEICIIECQQQGRSFYFGSGEDADSVLDGFTVSNGLIESWPGGGGIYINGSSPAISNYVFSSNSVVNGAGGGMYNNSSSPTVTGCTFIGNSAVDLYISGGGGMYNNGSSPTVTNCTFSGNLAFSGGGMQNWESTPTVTNCTFSGNSASRGGGGGIYSSGGELTLTNCLLTSNYAGSVHGCGGGVLSRHFNFTTLTNCTFAGNLSLFGGGGVAAIENSSLCIESCVFWENSSAWGSSIYLEEAINCTIRNSDIQHGLNGIHVSPETTFNWGENNMDANPLFVSEGYGDLGDWIDGDYHLLPDSPCIDSGDPNYIADPNGFDLDGNQRVLSGRIDLGPYEYVPDKFPDLNQDGIVNYEDFVILAYYWPDDLCSWPDWCQGSDIDESGTANGTDLTLLSKYWLHRADVKFIDFALDADPGWTIEGEWSYGEPTGDGGDYYGNPDPTTGRSGDNIYGVNLRGDYDETTLGQYYLTAGPLDCSEYENIKLKFARWLNTDDPDYVKSTVEVSSNGVIWNLAWEHDRRPAITDDNWRALEYDISPTADSQGTVYIRWGYEILPDAYPYSGWNIDDVELWGNIMQ